MNGQTLGRRNAAPMQSTELDLSSHMHDYHVKERMFCTLTARGLQGVTWDSRCSRQSTTRARRTVDSKKTRLDAKCRVGAALHSTRQPALEIRQDIYHRTWDIEGSLADRNDHGVRRNHERRGCPRTAGHRGSFRWISGPETAFVVQHERPNCRAAQRRPGAEHRARPVLPDDDPQNSSIPNDRLPQDESDNRKGLPISRRLKVERGPRRG